MPWTVWYRDAKAHDVFIPPLKKCFPGEKYNTANRKFWCKAMRAIKMCRMNQKLGWRGAEAGRAASRLLSQSRCKAVRRVKMKTNRMDLRFLELLCFRL